MKVTDDKKEKYSRECPNCSIKLYYKWTSDFYTSNKKLSKCKSCTVNTGQFKKDHKLNDIYNNSENSLDRLLIEDNQSFYWLGFLIADGYFSGHTFELGLAEKDKEHLEEFSKFISYNKDIKYRKETKSYRLNFNNRHSIPKIMDKYNLCEIKTYNPVNFEYFDKYDKGLIKSLLIGIIDGDGYISKNGSKNSFCINITAHKYWETFYEKIFEYIGIPVKIKNFKSKENIITISIRRKEFIDILLENIITNNIYHLSRKWDKIIKNREDNLCYKNI